MLTKRTFFLALGALSVAAVGVGSAAYVGRVQAADHLDPPGRTNPMSMGMDRSADIADLYAWHRGTGASATLVTALTFSGPMDPVAGQTVPCDRDVLYTIHIDNDGDNLADFDIETRFGEDDVGNCFVRVSNLPGASEPVEAAVELVTTRGDVTVFAGLRDDPFFFDLTGFQETLAMGTLRFVNDRDTFARKNDGALVFEFPLPATLEGGTALRVWATTSRIGG